MNYTIFVFLFGIFLWGPPVPAKMAQSESPNETVTTTDHLSNESDNNAPNNGPALSHSYLAGHIDVNLLEHVAEDWEASICGSWVWGSQFICHRLYMKSQLKTIKDWLTLSSKERSLFRNRNEDPKENLPLSDKYSQYLRILDEVERRDALSDEGQWISQAENAPWKTQTIEERAERWANFVREESPENKGFFFETFSEKEIEENKSSLIRWGQMSPYERDLEKISTQIHNEPFFRYVQASCINCMQSRKYVKAQHTSIYEVHFSLFYREGALRAIVRGIEAMDSLSREIRNGERLALWTSLTFEERDYWRQIAASQDPSEYLEYQIFWMLEEQENNPFVRGNLSTWLGETFIESIFEIKNQDIQLRNRMIMGAINQWLSLERSEREQLRQSGQDIRQQIDIELLGEEIEQVIRETENADFYEKFEQLRKRIEDYMLLSYEERHALRLNGNNENIDRETQEVIEDHELTGSDNYLAHHLRQGGISWFPEYQNIQDRGDLQKRNEHLNNMLADLEAKDNKFRDDLITHQMTRNQQLDMYRVESPDIMDLFLGRVPLR